METLEATETQIKEVESLLPAEIQDYLAEQAFKELKEAAEVPFTPVEDSAKLQYLINATEKKIRMLMSIDVQAQIEKDLQQLVTLQTEDGETKPVTLLERTTPTLGEILKLEERIASAISKYQKVLTEALHKRRLLSGQMFGTRMAHSSQISRVKRIRQVSLTGVDLMKQLQQGNTALTANQEVPLITNGNVIDITPEETTPNFEPRKDPLPFETIIEAQIVEPKKQAPKVVSPESLLCGNYDED